MCMVTLFLSETRTLHARGFDCQFLQLAIAAVLLSCGPLTFYPSLYALFFCALAITSCGVETAKSLLSAKQWSI